MIGLQLVKFGIVGITAMAVHLLVTVFFVNLQFHPLVANLVGFLIAFQVSYAGHSLWTFDLTEKDDKKYKIRFFTVAIVGFVSNEICYFLLLKFLHMDYRIALTLVLLLVSALTFILSKLWAFKE